jgi:hypothetical protein
MKRVLKYKNRHLIGLSIIAMFPFLYTASLAQDGDQAPYHFARNPFVTKSTGPIVQQQTAISSQYRFNGYVRTGDRIQVMFENQGKSYHLFVGENRDGVSLREAKVDGDNKYVILTVGAETFRLDLVRDSNAGMMNPMPMQGSMQHPSMMPPMPMQMPQPYPSVGDQMNPDPQMNSGQPSPPSAPRRRIIVPRRAQ